MFLLRWAPYEEDSADVLAISCAITLTLSVLGGYVLMANHCDDCLTKNTIDPKVMDYGLIVMNSLPILIFLDWHICSLVFSVLRSSLPKRA